MLRRKNSSANKRTEAKTKTERKGKPKKQVTKFNRMEIAIYTIGIVATIIFGVAAYFVSFHNNLKTPSIWLLFASLVLYALGFCLFLQDKIWKYEAEAQQATNNDVTPISTALPMAIQRPYIVITDIHLESPINSGKPPIVLCMMENTGATPAFNMTVEYNVALVKGKPKENAEKGLMPENPPVDSKSVGVIVPGQSANFRTPPLVYKDAEQKMIALRGQFGFYVWGEINYTDSANKPHFTEFCYYSNDITNTSLVLCGQGNEIDK
jgi:hypothetical protein